jgi:hypothetical protein
LREVSPNHAVACERALAGEVPAYWLKSGQTVEAMEHMLAAEAYLAANRERING